MLDLIGTEQSKTADCGSNIATICAYLKSSGEDATIADALRWLTNMIAAPASLAKLHSTSRAGKTTGSNWRVVRSEPIEDLALIRYLENSGIPLHLARQFLQEVYIKNKADNKTAYALGLKNEDGGYELRSPFVKSLVAPATIAFIRSRKARPTVIHIFNGFMDMLSAFTRFPRLLDEGDVICLTALSCLNEAFPYLIGYGYQNLYSWMDNDEAGHKVRLLLAEFVKTQLGLRHRPMNGKYQAFGNVHEWHVSSHKIR